MPGVRKDFRCSGRSCAAISAALETAYGAIKPSKPSCCSRLPACRDMDDSCLPRRQEFRDVPLCATTTCTSTGLQVMNGVLFVYCRHILVYSHKLYIKMCKSYKDRHRQRQFLKCLNASEWIF